MLAAVSSGDSASGGHYQWGLQSINKDGFDMTRAMGEGPYCNTQGFPFKGMGQTAEELALLSTEETPDHLFIEAEVADVTGNSVAASQFYDESLYSMWTHDEFKCAG